MSTYSFIDVSATIVGPGGAFNLGAGAGVTEEGITITREADQGKLVVGADGEFMHVLNANKSGTVTVRLIKTSPVNAQLMALYDTQAANSRLYGQNVITIHQSNSGDTIVCRGCAFKKMPDLSYKQEHGKDFWIARPIARNGGPIGEAFIVEWPKGQAQSTHQAILKAFNIHVDEFNAWRTRLERDAKLKHSDWTQMPDVEESKRKAWVNTIRNCATCCRIRTSRHALLGLSPLMFNG